MQCPGCHTENREGRRFCTKCGAPLAVACAACGFANDPTDQFCGGCGAPLGAPPSKAPSTFASPDAYTPRHLAEKILTSKASLEGERKQVTVLFVDVSGFTAISSRLDPEDVHGFMRRAFERMLAEVHRYEGTVNQFLGDGIMALFGAPVAHEDHARRAVHAALGIRQALDAYQDELRAAHGVTFRVRQGLNTGLVVVGSIGDDLRMDYTAVGDTTNVAARMQQAAGPGHVVVSEATHRLVSGYFEMQSLGALALKGKAEAVPAWDVVSAHLTRTRFEVDVDRGLTPLVGRERELDLLQDAFARSAAGQGHIVFVVGEAGIGKSRLLHELHQRVGDRATWLEGRCLSFGHAIPFHPLIDLLRRHFEIDGSDPDAAIIERIEAAVSRLGEDLRPITPYLRSLLGVDPGDPAVARMNPQLRRAEIVEAVVRLIGGGARFRPQVLVIEDLHWIDNASEELLVALADAVAALPVLLVFTYRTGYRHPFGERTYHVRIAPAALSAQDTARIAEGVLATPRLSAEIAEMLARAGEGNPFYVEEVVRSLRESGVIRETAGGYVAAARLDTVVVPSTIQDVIMARIDRLEEAPKRTLQLASVIGREFTRRLLDQLATAGEPLDPALRELKAIELIRETQRVPEPAYAFRHALTQDVAYHSLLRERRKELHQRIGCAIEELHADRIGEHHAILAHHFSRAEVWEKALAQLLAAGQQAVRAFALRDALALYGQAQAAADQLGAQVPVDQRLAIRRARAGLLYTVGDYAEAQRAADDLLSMAREAGNRAVEAEALVQGAWSTVWMEDFPGGLERAGRAIDLGATAGAEAGLSGGLLVSGMVYAVTGRHERAEAELQRARGIAGSARDVTLHSSAAGFLGFLRNWHGRYEEALALSSEGVQAGREHPQLLAVLTRSLWTQGVAATGLGDYDAGLRALEEGLQLCEKLDNELEINRLLNTLGMVYMQCGAFDAGLAFSRRGLEIARRSRHATGFERVAFNLVDQADGFLARGDLALASGVLDEAVHIVQHPPESRWMTWRYSTHCWVSLGELALTRGDIERAERYANQALEIAVPTRSRKYESRAWRVKGDVALRRPQLGEAEDAFRRALALAAEIGEPREQWLNHAAMARLLEARRDRAGARQAYRAAQAIVDRVRTSLRHPELRAGLERLPVLREISERAALDG
jgi:class 3 adenylate cyclase/tetratricopeptide (TPR) repeat protein